MRPDRHILIVEDEPDIAEFIELGLQEEGYMTTWRSRGEDIRQRDIERADLVLLDVRLPGISGLDVCVNLRSVRHALPVIMLSALHAVEDRVRGLGAGADDYIPKPFAFEELVARIQALLRRRELWGQALDADERIAAGGLLLDHAAHTCCYDGEEIALTPREFALLAYFMEQKGRALDRDTLHRDVWGHDFDRGTNLVDVYVAYVRQKLRDVGCTSTIETVRGVGYRFSPTEGSKNP